MNNGKICVSVAAETADEMIEKIRRAEPFADVIEVRFDSLAKQDFDMDADPSPTGWNEILQAATKPIISTYRPKTQGGFHNSSQEERRRFWNSGYETDYCDVEEEFVEDSWNWLWWHRICSYHDLTGIPDDLDSVFDRIRNAGATSGGAGPDIVKIAVTVTDATDAISVWKLIAKAKQAGTGIIPIAMGEAGKWTRILGLAHGAYLTYAALEDGQETADGQITAREMIDVYRVKELDRDTKVYGVIGDPVSESLSPYMHNAAFAAAGMNAVFLPLLVKDLDAFMTRMVLPATREVELNFAGFAVTMPHKQAVMKYLDEVDETAQKIGAVNTIKIDADGKLHGFNTDIHGFITPLKKKLSDLHGARVAILGAGGAARACAYALGKERAEVQIFARDEQKANAFASHHGATANTISNLRSEISNFDLLVNATPLGMKGQLANDSTLTADELKGVKLVFDLVTSSTDTPLIREAKKAGIPTVRGAEMLIQQGAKQFEIWTGGEAPVEVMKQAVLARMENAG